MTMAYQPAKQNTEASGFQVAAPARVKSAFPFAAIVGMEQAKRAMMLLAIDSHLKGVMICAGAGSAKSLLARSFTTILPDAPFIEVPLNVTEERLLGSVDIERTIATGRRAIASGLLAEADGGILFADDASLLDASIARHIGNAIDCGAVRVEREGLSANQPARFLFIGTWNPDEGDVAACLREKVGLLVEIESQKDSKNVSEIINRAMRFEKDAAGFADENSEETCATRELIKIARLLFSKVRITSEDNLRIAQAAMSLGIEGNRADIFAARAARANAALEGREQVVDDDLVIAIRLALLGRATRMPDFNKADESRAEPESSERRERDSKRESNDAGNAQTQKAIEELIIEAMDSPAPAVDLMRKKFGQRGESGRRSVGASISRGRYSQSKRARNRNKKIAIDATLRAAAPFQLARNGGDEGRANRSRLRVKIKPDDLRYKRFKQKSGVLFIFAVDASGSMAANRMAQAKGALTRLLQTAYLHRDKVALVSFRQKEAQVLLSPTRSVELAKRLVDALPAGGATPLAAGLIASLNVARIARLQGMTQAIIVIFTDGRANVHLSANESSIDGSQTESIRNELRHIGAVLETEGIGSMIIDTRPRFVSTGEASLLADLLRSQYVYLPRADAERVYKEISAATANARQRKEY